MRDARSTKRDMVKERDEWSFRRLPWLTALFIKAARHATTAHVLGAAGSGFFGVINARLLTDRHDADGWCDPAMACTQWETGSMGRIDL